MVQRLKKETTTTTGNKGLGGILRAVVHFSFTFPVKTATSTCDSNNLPYINTSRPETLPGRIPARSKVAVEDTPEEKENDTKETDLWDGDSAEGFGAP